MAIKQWIVSGHYSLIVEAETEAEAIDRGCDKIGNGWEWQAVQVGGVERDLEEVLDEKGEEVRASALNDGDLYAEPGMDPQVVHERWHHGDTVLLTNADGSETVIDGDVVVRRVPRGEF